MINGEINQQQQSMKQRVVRPELLDELDSHDPHAIRSRRDLRMINQIIRGENWILKNLKAQKQIQKVIELGAGEGTLCRKIHQTRPDITITAVDLAPRPTGLPVAIKWQQENILQTDLNYDESTAIVANLFLHHFQDDVIIQLSTTWNQAGMILLAEPYRSSSAIHMAKLLHPFINHVTRHDMKISIKAGFLLGEIPALLGNDLLWEENLNPLGSLRCKGVRK